MPSSYLIAAQRTPMGKFLGSLASLAAPQLAAPAIQAALQAANITPQRVDELILGNVLQAGVGQAPARQAALAAGCPPTIAALTINKVCGSGLKAVMLADQAIRAQDARVIVAGGMESMSQAPHLALGARAGWKYGHQTLLDSLLYDGLTCSTEHAPMGQLADYIANRFQISRADQDAFAAESQHRAAAARAAGKFRAEITPITVRLGKTETVVQQDEGPRPNTTAADLAKLRPAFDAAGTATAGNASQLSDGAAALVVVDESTARETTSVIKARIVAAATSGVAPKDLFIAPVAAIQLALKKSQLTLADIDLIELNEAFASQCLACLKELKLDSTRVNVNGGAIALGHPIGASGARVLVTLLHALADRGLRYGLVSLCLGGGNAVAMVVERSTD